ncbi:hypothetical protein MJ1_0605 [Nanobdella aerobiophila]|uniref:Uncharacterized protein n=1 Tax=Nanobdella aerobiophila TaxID=2586965 RepID=A0A915WRK6_9ARCH|nr:hypothetical protein [Nanobdella aerobiophila]BBL45753.1 hypothetical protein MJ1_0605 [Nanobdella aerobiophila]
MTVIFNEELDDLIYKANQINIDQLKSYEKNFESLAKILKKGKYQFLELDRFRIPYQKLDGYANLNEIKWEGCNLIGNLAIAKYLDLKDKDVSNIIDLVCEKPEDTLIQLDKIIKNISGYKILPNNVFGYYIRDKNIKIPNQYGLYYYIELENQVYFVISTGGNIIVNKSSIEVMKYIENCLLFSFLSKFIRYKDKDIYDLEEYEKYEKTRDIVYSGFSEKDINNIREILNPKYIEKGRKNIRDYLSKNPRSIYKELEGWFNYF